jgi:hypothetical protein
VVRRGLLLVLLWSSAFAGAPTSRPAATATTENGRLAAEYFVQRAGASWVYQLAQGKGRVTITSFVDWRAVFSFSFGKRAGAGSWRIKEGAWTERSSSRGEGELVLLPSTMTRGTRWVAPASLERGGGAPAQYEVVALDAVVDLPRGPIEGCLAVLETSLDGQGATTHYFAPGMGQVAVRGPDDWLYRLLEFNPGSRGHGD